MATKKNKFQKKFQKKSFFFLDGPALTPLLIARPLVEDFFAAFLTLQQELYS